MEFARERLRTGGPNRGGTCVAGLPDGFPPPFREKEARSMPGGGKRAGVDDLVLWRTQPTLLSHTTNRKRRKREREREREYVPLNRSGVLSSVLSRFVVGVRWPRDNGNFFFLWVGFTGIDESFVVTSLVIGRGRNVGVCVCVCAPPRGLHVFCTRLASCSLGKVDLGGLGLG